MVGGADQLIPLNAPTKGVALADKLLRARSSSPLDGSAARPPEQRRVPRRGPRHWLSWVYLTGGVAAIVASVAMPEHTKIVMLSLVQFCGGIAVLVGVRLQRPARGAGWIWLGIGSLLLGAGDASWFPYAEIWHRPIPYPGWSDALFIPGYVALAVGLALLIRQRAPARGTPAVLDALIFAVGFGFANWIFLTGPAAHEALTAGQRIIAIVYPAIDVLLVGLVVRLLVTGGRKSRSLWLLASGAVALLAGDSAYTLAARFGSYHVGDLSDQLWMVSLVLVGAAALHPSMVAVAVENEGRREGTTRVQLGVLVAALQLPALVILAAVLTGKGVSSTAILALFACFGPLVSIRTVQLAVGLRKLALVDPLTGLPNRDVLVDRLVAGTRAAQRHPGRAALLSIDLDGFKRVNDTLGHCAGDQLLISVGQRLRRLVRLYDVVVRLGGDEFAVLCELLPPLDDLDRLADRVVAGLAEPFVISDAEVFIGASVGVVTLDGTDPESLLRNADIAMYVAKGLGRSRWERFTPPMLGAIVDEILLESEIRHALDSDELVLHYQPVVDLVSGKMTGVEALVRWQHPTRGLLAPAEFVPAAEKSGAIVALGSWALATASRQLAEWNAARPDSAALTMAVNLSARQLSDEGIVALVEATLACTGLDPASLCLELTETALLSSSAAATSIVAALAQLGVSIAIDDFGTRYASLTYLQQLDVDIVKIDKSFVEGLGVKREETAIVAAVIGLAKAMGLSVIGEGVESIEQLLLLRDMGCDLVQGYHLCRPVPAAELNARLDDDWCGVRPSLDHPKPTSIRIATGPFIGDRSAGRARS